MCYLLNFDPKSREVKREQRQLSGILQDRWAPEMKHKTKVVQLTQITTLRVKGIFSCGCLWDWPALQSTSTDLLLRVWELGDDG